MTATTDRSPPTSPPPSAPLRLGLKPAGDSAGLLDGAWWPYSRDLSRELPPLIAVLDSKWGRITRIAVNPEHWPVIPRRVAVAGHVVKVGWFTAEQDPHKLLLLSGHVGRWDLLVIPPETDPTTCRWLTRAACDPRRPATASALLQEARGITARDPARTDAPLEERAWEGEGGAYLHDSGAIQRTTMSPAR
ncbi:DUF5994 family protein [Streptomyces sp. RKND-216]|uniref:DUF5994 family protein n=1 Tax=Streptomyces sp. RKND-216 TaxID=2562581 RepID=UPI001B3541AE|nr:DUF5994 family protein [Streptomyces sp. RKND-216]